MRTDSALTKHEYIDAITLQSKRENRIVKQTVTQLEHVTKHSIEEAQFIHRGVTPYCWV